MRPCARTVNRPPRLRLDHIRAPLLSSPASMKPSESVYVPVRGLRYHCRCWGDARAPKLFMLHGWMDVSASFQFVVDALRGEWRVIAPDWRGFGLSEWAKGDGYWFPDYFADLDRLLGHFQPAAPAVLVGHSMAATSPRCTPASARSASRSSSTSKALAFGARAPERRPGATRNGLASLPTRSRRFATTIPSKRSPTGCAATIRASPGRRHYFSRGTGARRRRAACSSRAIRRTSS